MCEPIVPLTVTASFPREIPGAQTQGINPNGGSIDNKRSLVGAAAGAYRIV